MNQIVRQPIAATVTSIVAEKLRPLVQRIDADGYYPAQVLRDVGGAAAYAHHTATLGRGPEGLTPAIEAMAEAGASCMSTAFCM